MTQDLSTNTEPGDHLRRLEARLAEPIDLARLKAWLLPLNGACAKPLLLPEVEARCLSLLVLLGDLPASVFTVESARRVRAVNFPSATAIRSAVMPALREATAEVNRAKQNTPTGGARERAHSEAGRWLEYYRARMAGTVEGMPRANEAHLLSLLRTQSPAAYEMAVGAAREVIDAEASEKWWADHIRSLLQDETSPKYHHNPTMRWREAGGMLAALTQPEAHVQQWAVDRLVGIMRQADADGADTTEIAHALPRVNPRRPAASLFGEPDKVPFSDRQATQAARASAVGAPAPGPEPRTLSPAQLAAAYQHAGAVDPRGVSMPSSIQETTNA